MSLQYPGCRTFARQWSRVAPRPESGGLLPSLRSMVHCFGHAAARLVFGREDVQPLHHAEVLMCKTVAMHDETPDSLGVEIDAKGYRADIHILIEVWLIGLARKSCGLWFSPGNEDSVVPFRLVEFYTVDVGEQKRVLMDVERMIRK